MGVAILQAATAILLIRHARGSLRDPGRAAACIFGASAAVNCAWGAVALTIRPTPTYIHPDPVDAGFSYFSMLLALGNVVSLAWLSLCVHRQELKTVAETDSLTGLQNRGAFEEVLRRDLARCHHGGPSLGIMLIDVDFFKQVNDAHGHQVGDEVLKRISEALRRGTRPSDTLARYGGEEFVILLQGASLETTHEVAERLRADIASLSDLPLGLSLTASFGVTVNHPGDSARGLMLRADEALYRSKREGRNLVRVSYAAPQASLAMG
jgi:diguanylate cyclase (GGDEF)-like protein